MTCMRWCMRCKRWLVRTVAVQHWSLLQGFSPRREQKCRVVWGKIFQSHQDFCPHKISQDPRRIGSNRMVNPSWTADLKINHLHSTLSKNAFPCASSATIAVWSKTRMQKLLEAFSFHALGPKTFLSRGKAFNTRRYSRLHRITTHQLGVTHGCSHASCPGSWTRIVMVISIMDKFPCTKVLGNLPRVAELQFVGPQL